MVSSSYRSYQEQEIVYNNYKKTRGQKYADSIAARPGASEHQTGLSLDIFSKLNNNKLKNSHYQLKIEKINYIITYKYYE